MRRRVIESLEWLPLLLLAAIALALAGCVEHTPKQRVADARAMYVASLHEINTRHHLGKLSIETKRSLAPTTQKIAATLDAADVVVSLDQDPYVLLQQVDQLIDELLRLSSIDPVTMQKIKKAK